MKRILNLSLVALLLMLVAAPAQAQGLGGLLKKAKKVVQGVSTVTNATSSTTTDTALSSTIKAVAIPSGGTMENPIPDIAEFELVGAYGKSSSLNYGDVYLVVKVKAVQNLPSLSFGSSVKGVEMLAVDQAGNTYSPAISVWTSKPVTEGLFVKMTLDGNSHVFKNVKKSATSMQLIRLTVSANNDPKGVVCFKNVPVQWDVTPE